LIRRILNGDKGQNKRGYLRGTAILHISTNGPIREGSPIRLNKILDEGRREWRTKEEVGEAFVNFFQKLYTTEGTKGIDLCLEGLEMRVTEDMNEKLISEFSRDEVETALMGMAPLKSPSPNGYSACFFQKSWNTVYPEVCEMVLRFLNGGNFEPLLNQTCIALIPKKKKKKKKKKSSSVMEFRPISLCNVIYKIIAKAIANRLKKCCLLLFLPIKVLL
jgi:hypothetical protein